MSELSKMHEGHSLYSLTYGESLHKTNNDCVKFTFRLIFVSVCVFTNRISDLSLRDFHMFKNC